MSLVRLLVNIVSFIVYVYCMVLCIQRPTEDVAIVQHWERVKTASEQIHFRGVVENRAEHGSSARSRIGTTAPRPLANCVTYSLTLLDHNVQLIQRPGFRTSMTSSCSASSSSTTPAASSATTSSSTTASSSARACSTAAET